jgi:hypothetical protein
MPHSKVPGYLASLVPRSPTGRKGAAVRSKRQHPLRRFAPAILAKAGTYPLKDLSSASAALAGSFAGLKPCVDRAGDPARTKTLRRPR